MSRPARDLSLDEALSALGLRVVGGARIGRDRRYRLAVMPRRGRAEDAVVGTGLDLLDAVANAVAAYGRRPRRSAGRFGS